MERRFDTLEVQLGHDLKDLSPRIGDNRFCAELYRALTNRTLSRDDRPQTHLVLSWNQAAQLVNELRAREDHEPLPLSGSGREGVISQVLLDELADHGWHTRPFGH